MSEPSHGIPHRTTYIGVLFFSACCLMCACRNDANETSSVDSEDAVSFAGSTDKGTSSAEGSLPKTTGESPQEKLQTSQQNQSSPSAVAIAGDPVWLKLPAQTSSVGSDRAVTISALPVGIKRKSRHEATPDELRRVYGYDSSEMQENVCREKNVFLPGEPILVRFAIELFGKGEWRADDWRYFNNRDETFIFLLRDEKGEWVPDRYHPRMAYSYGGRWQSGNYSQENPEIHWLPVQQYCAVTAPGTYDLFCFKYNTRCELRKIFPPSPLLSDIPGDVVARARKQPITSVDFATDYAHISISIRQGSDADRARMVRSWAELVDQDAKPSPWRGLPKATIRAWEHCLQNDFLPYLYAWKRQYHDPAMTPYSLFSLSDEVDRWDETLLTTGDMAAVIPRTIEELAAADASTRSTAEFHLRQWTGTAFGHHWQGHKYDRPTPEEGVAMQEQWFKWWQENSAAFLTPSPQADTR